jgi:hypothetical protein
VAVVNFREAWPEFGAEWDELGRRTLAVMTALRALDPSGGWSPPMPADGHPG